MLDFQLSTIVFTIINLLVLYLILRKLLFGRVNAVLEQREKLIARAGGGGGGRENPGPGPSGSV